MPSRCGALLVEPRGALVSDRACKPGRGDTAAAKPSFRIGDQSRGHTRRYYASINETNFF
jgi:hypothetical protein